MSWIYMLYPSRVLDAITKAEYTRSLAYKTLGRSNRTVKRFVEELILPMLKINLAARLGTEDLLRVAF